MSESDTATAADAVPEEEDSGIRWKMAITALIFGLLIGGFGAWATLNLGGAAPFVFLVGFVAGAYYLYKKEIPSSAIGTGCYIIALEMLLVPILFYVPVVLRSGEGESVEAAGTFIGSLMGLVIWGFVFLILAIVTAAIGFFANRRAKKELNAA